MSVAEGAARASSTKIAWWLVLWQAILLVLAGPAAGRDDGAGGYGHGLSGYRYMTL
jgi:hypothetical protein